MGHHRTVHLTPHHPDANFVHCYSASDVNTSWSAVSSLILDGCNKFIPKRKATQRYPCWYTVLNIKCSITKIRTAQNVLSPSSKIESDLLIEMSEHYLVSIFFHDKGKLFRHLKAFNLGPKSQALSTLIDLQSLKV